MSRPSTSADRAKRYRVVQWATGNVGARALRRAIEHPDLELVGVYVHSAGKAGRDAGELAGIAPIGINAVPYVCEAPAGIRTTTDLPQIIARLG